MSIIHELAEASRRRKIKVWGSGDTSHSFIRCIEWDMPSFDFGDLIFNITSPASTFDLSKKAELTAHADLLHNSGFGLPFPRCAIIMREPCGGITVDIFHQTEKHIVHVVFIRGANPLDSWCFVPLRCYFEHKFKEYFAELVCISKSEWQWLMARIGQTNASWVQNIATKAGLAFAMLSTPSAEQEALSSDLAASVNRGRAKGKLAPIPDSVAVRFDPVTIRLNPTSSGNSHAGTGSGTPRCPHDRRAHSRRLRSGRVVSVKATSIHGGGDGTRQYRVVA